MEHDPQAVQTAFAPNWLADDQLLWQRAASHVREAVLTGALPACNQGVRTGPQWQWLRPLRNMLLTERAHDHPMLTELADVLASACMGSRHLWQDLGLNGRDDVSRLIQLGFPAIYSANTGHLRWKRHLFLRLGASLGLGELRPPKCDDCDGYAECMSVPLYPEPERPERRQGGVYPTEVASFTGETQTRQVMPVVEWCVEPELGTNSLVVSMISSEGEQRSFVLGATDAHDIAKVLLRRAS